MPESYRIDWGKKSEESSTEMILRFPQNDAIKGSTGYLKFRSNAIKTLLMMRVEEYHSNFLKEKNKVFESSKVWHPEFMVHDVPDIPLTKLPDPPSLQRPELIQTFLSKTTTTNPSDNLNPRVMEIFERNFSSKISTSSESWSRKVGLSEELLSKIRIKEQLLKKEIATKEDEKINNIEILLKIYEKLKVYYTMRNVSNMFLMNVVDYLSKEEYSISSSKGFNFFLIKKRFSIISILYPS